MVLLSSCGRQLVTGVFGEAVKLLKPSIMFLFRSRLVLFFLSPPEDLHLWCHGPTSERENTLRHRVKWKQRWGGWPVGGIKRKRCDYNSGIRGVICTGWQLVGLHHYLLPTPSCSSFVLLQVITVVNLLPSPCKQAHSLVLFLPLPLLISPFPLCRPFAHLRFLSPSTRAIFPNGRGPIGVAIVYCDKLG